MRQMFRFLLLSFACAAFPAIAQAQSPAPASWPANLRWDLVPKWIQWANEKADIHWPPNDGCTAAPVTATIPAGTLIDRFGSEGGTFFSPKGESFKSRAVPYVCKAMDYRVYRVLKALTVKSCRAAPWFNEPGGAKQVQTSEPAYKLVADKVIEAIEYDVGGSGKPSPLCGNP